MRCGFSIKKPANSNQAFAVYKKIYRVGQKPWQPKLIDERLNSINANFKSGVLTIDEALLQIKALIAKLKLELNVQTTATLNSVISETNLKAYSEFYKATYEDRKLRRPDRVVNEFNYLLRNIEPLSVISASKKELQTKVDKVFDESQHWRYVGRLNKLLTFVGRDFQIHIKRRKKSKVRYLDLAEFKKVVSKVADPDLQSLYTFLFGTGCRLGEAFRVKDRDIKPNGTIYICEQLTDKLEIEDVKNGKHHHTVIISECMAGVKAWAALPYDKKVEIRTRCQHMITKAAKATFTDAERWVSCHDLRHSYAIHMLGLGVPLDKVAKLIGDSLKTTEDYYAGFTMSDNEVDFVTSIISKSKRKKTKL